MNPSGFVNPDLINKPPDMIGSNYMGFQSIDDRVIPLPYAVGIDATAIYRAKGTNVRPTVGDWEKMSGRIIVKCREDGSSKVSIRVKNAFPNIIALVRRVDRLYRFLNGILV